MKRIMLNVLLLVCVLSAPQVSRGSADKLPLRVLYLGRENDQQRTTAFFNFLSETFLHCAVAKRQDFQLSLLDDIDVVVVDWSQQERQSGKYKSPLGPLDQWHTPTVFLGSAGLLMAGPWSVIGGAG